MIQITRKLNAKINQWAHENGKAPSDFVTTQQYPVVGYSTSMRPNREEGTGEHEELTAVFIIDQNQRLRFVYTNLLDFYIDTTEGKPQDGKKTQA